MDNLETPHPDYLKGFNEGYMITTHLPELAESLAKSIGESSRGAGFRDGKNQFIMEQRKDRYPDWLKNDRLSNLDHPSSKSKGHDREIVEKE